MSNDNALAILVPLGGELWFGTFWRPLASEHATTPAKGNPFAAPWAS
jgi:hypothetical protein